MNLDFNMQLNCYSLAICFGNPGVNKALDRGTRRVNKRGERMETRGRCVLWRRSQLGLSDRYVLSAPCCIPC